MTSADSWNEATSPASRSSCRRTGVAARSNRIRCASRTFLPGPKTSFAPPACADPTPPSCWSPAGSCFRTATSGGTSRTVLPSSSRPAGGGRSPRPSHWMSPSSWGHAFASAHSCRRSGRTCSSTSSPSAGTELGCWPRRVSASRKSRFTTCRQAWTTCTASWRASDRCKHAARRGETRAGGSVAFHGHGLGRDADDERLIEYFRVVDRSVAAAVGTNGVPLVVAAVEHFLPLYRETTALPSVIDGAVQGSPDELSDAELHDRAWPLVAPLAERDIDEQLVRYAEHAAKGGAAHGVEGVLHDAQAARIETLFIPVDDVVWGKFDTPSGKARIHDARRAGDEDLLDRAAVETIRTGGRVLCLPKAGMPDGGPMAAIRRY